MKKYMFKVNGKKTTVSEAIYVFCVEMFDHKRAIDSVTITGNAFSNDGLSFGFIDGEEIYKVVYRDSMKVFEFFQETAPDR